MQRNQHHQHAQRNLEGQEPNPNGRKLRQNDQHDGRGERARPIDVDPHEQPVEERHCRRDHGRIDEMIAEWMESEELEQQSEIKALDGPGFVVAKGGTHFRE